MTEQQLLKLWKIQELILDKLVAAMEACTSEEFDAQDKSEFMTCVKDLKFNHLENKKTQAYFLIRFYGITEELQIWLNIFTDCVEQFEHNGDILKYMVNAREQLQRFRNIQKHN